MRVMEITLKTSGLVTASNLLTRLANSTDKYGLALQKIEQTTRGLSLLSTATDAASTKVGKLTQALKDAVAEQEKLGKGKINPQADTGTGAGSGSRGPRFNFAADDSTAKQKLEKAQAALVALEVAGTGTAEELRKAKLKIERLGKAVEAEERLLFLGPRPNKIKPEPLQRFTPGPEQKLLKLQEERARAEALPEGKQKTAILADNARSLFLQERMIELNRRRQENRQESLTRPGLLELFGELNSILGNIRGGDLLGAAKHGKRALGFIQNADPDRPGGLNIEQTIAAAGNGRSLFYPGGAADAAKAAGSGTKAASFGAGMLAKALPLLTSPIAIFAGVVITAGVALKAMQHSAKEAAASLNRLGDLQATTGGTTGQAAQLQALGIDPGLGASLRSTLTSDGLAAGTAAGMGINIPSPRPFGGTNEAELALKVTDKLRGMYKESASETEQVTMREQQLRTARILGAESLLSLLRVSDKVYAAMKRDAEIRNQIADKRFLQVSADYAANLKRSASGMQAISDVIGKQFLPSAASFEARWATLLHRIAGALDSTFTDLRKHNEKVSKKQQEFDDKVTFGLTKWFREGFEKMFPEGDKPKANDPQLEALNKQYEELVKIHKALEAGLTGGGRDAGKAIPDRMRGWRADDEAKKRRQRYGGVTV